MNAAFVSIFTCLLCLSSYAADHGNDLSGAWVTETTEKIPSQQLVVFESKNGVWSGTMTSRFGTMKLEQIVLDGSTVAFSQVFHVGIAPTLPVRVHGELREGKLILNVPAPTGGFTQRVARKASAEEVASIKAAVPKSPRLSALPDNGLARTPPLGWNSWNHFGLKIDDKTTREVADVLVTSGLRDVGYVYVVIDDGWQGKRDANGVLQPNAKFPDMKGLASYIHSRGLKFGIYSGPGARTCGGYEGSYGYEEQDAKTFAQWGVDYLKYDWCDASFIHSTPAEMQAAYRKMGAALQATGRPIVYALCQYGLFDVGQWGRKVGGHLWRTTYDIRDYWSKMEEIALAQIGRESHAGPGGWNDPDMLEVGNGGMTPEESKTHMTLWSMLSAPLLLGNDVRHMAPELKALIANPEVIAINQDVLGLQAKPLRESTEIWTKPLADGSVAVALINRNDDGEIKELPWWVLGFTEVGVVRDVWKQAEIEVQPEAFRTRLSPHGAVLLRAWPRRVSSAAK